MNDTPLNIAVIGTGVAGLTAAYILQRQHKVTLFEKNANVGGHTNTIVIPSGPEKWTPVDTGFVLLNEKTYPAFHELLRQLKVSVRNCDISFSFYDEKSGLQYSGANLNGLFAQRSNLWNSSFWMTLREMSWFNRKAKKDLAAGLLDQITLGQYLEGEGFSQRFIQDFLVPFGSAIWSSSVMDIMDFPAEIFVEFLQNNGLLGSKKKPQWQTVVEGSHSYIRTLLKTMVVRVRVKEPVEEVKRQENQILLRTKGGKEESFDKVVLACHADESLAMLADPSEEEQKLLSPWKYQKNNVVLHTDIDVMPPLKRAWAAWNYTRETDRTKSQPVSITYHMNRLQGLETPTQYFVTHNRVRPIPQQHILKEIYYTHPTFTRAAVETQLDLHKLNGMNHTYFCGSYFGYGSHEDAVKSGVAVGKCFGLDL